MKNILIVTLIGVLAAAGFWFFRTLNSAGTMLHSLANEKIAYLSDRFSVAYGTEAANIAIWEGTNYLAEIDQEWNAPLSVPQRARLAITHARMCVLFNEVGMSNQMALEASQADKWVRTISTNLGTLSAYAAVSNLIARDSVKRPGSTFKP